MPIRKKQDPDEPIVIYGLKVDRAKHPALHAHLLSLGLGRPRMDYIRDQLEEVLQGRFCPSEKPIEKAGGITTQEREGASSLREGGHATSTPQSAEPDPDKARRMQEAAKLAGKWNL